jgi:hypothetical protein
MVEWGTNPDLVEGLEPHAAERSIHHRADDHQTKGAYHDRDNDHGPDDYHEPDNDHRTVVTSIRPVVRRSEPTPSSLLVAPSHQDPEKLRARRPRHHQRAVGIGAPTPERSGLGVALALRPASWGGEWCATAWCPWSWSRSLRR